MTTEASEFEREVQRPATPDDGVPGERWIVAALLLLGLLLRLPGLTEAWSGKGFNSALGSFGTAEFVDNFASYGFLESGGMPYRWRVELEDGTVVREWYAHHPVAFAWITLASRMVFGAAEWAIRLPWLLLSMLLPWAAWRSLRSLYGARVAVGAVVGVTAVPLAAHYALMPWVDNGVLVAAFLPVVARFTRWLERGERRDLWHATAWMLLASLLDWTAALLLPALGVAALVVAVRRPANDARPRGLGLLLRALLLPATLLVSAGLHAVHMLTVIGWDEVLHDASTTWTRTRTGRLAWGDFVRGQGRALELDLGWVTLVALALGLLFLAARQVTRRGALAPLRLWMLVALLLPGALYVFLFPFRGANHDFMWIQSLGGFAALVGFALAGLGGSTRRWGAGAAALLLLGFGAQATLARHRATSSEIVRLASQHPTLAPLLVNERGVLVTAMGQGWSLMPYARAPIVPRVEELGELERLRADVLSRLGEGRPVHFLFDVQFRNVHADLLAYLRAAGPSVQVLDALRADPVVAFEIFDLGEWARRP